MIDKEFICNIFRVITTRTKNTGSSINITNQNRHNKILEFHNLVYKNLIPQDDHLLYDNLKFILPYNAIEMETNINNNTSEHFCDHLLRYLKIRLEVKNVVANIRSKVLDKNEQKKHISSLFSQVKSVFKDITYYTESIETLSHEAFIKEMRTILFGNIISTLAKDQKRNNFEKHLNYDLKVSPEKYLYSMIALSKLFELLPKVNNQEVRIFNAVPLRTEVSPKTICFDTCGLIINLFLQDYMKPKETASQALNHYAKNKQKYWNMAFKLKNRIFGLKEQFDNKGESIGLKNRFKDKEFHYMIRTDGVSCCVLFHPLNAQGKEIKGVQLQKELEKESKYDLQYIEKFVKLPEARSFLPNKLPVCIDPGKQDLIYCGKYDMNGNFESFRYTKNQRKFEMKIEEFQKKRERIKPENIQKIENFLALHNSKTSDLNKFYEYVWYKNLANVQLRKHYEKKVFRQMKFYTYMNMQKSEDKMLNNFEKKFGKPDETYVVLGNWSKNEERKGNEPTINKRFRKLFRRRKYGTFLIDEFRTSKTCNHCDSELEKFHPKVKLNEKGESVKFLCHGLLRCTNSVCEIKHDTVSGWTLGFQTIHNRDKNAVKNMYRILRHLYTYGDRPEPFKRGITNST